MQATLVFPPAKSIFTATNLFVDGLDVHAIGNSWSKANSVVESRGPHNRSGSAQVQHSASLKKQITLKKKVPAPLEGLLVDNGRWLAGGFAEILASEDQGETWHPFATMPDTFPVHTIARHEGRLWAASPHGFMARQKEPSESGTDPIAWEGVGTPFACHKSPVWYGADRPYPDFGISRLKVLGPELYLVGKGLFTVSVDPKKATLQYIESKTLLVDVARTATGATIVVGVEGVYHRRATGAAWNAWESTPQNKKHPGYVAIVPIGDGVLRVSKRGANALEWSTDDGRTFTPIACPALAEPGTYLHLAVPDGHGGALVSGFNGLLIRVSPEGGLGPWENVKPAKKAAAAKAKSVETRAPSIVAASAKDAAIGAKLLAEIYAARDDDAPRLVYADWLTEHADPRGEFIQLQCELKRPIWGAEGYVATNDRTRLPANHVELTQREQVIFKKHAKSWLAPIRSFIRKWNWRRGFLAQVTTGPNFLDGASAVLRTHPIELLSLEGMKASDLAKLAKTPLPFLENLSLCSQRISKKAAGFFASEHLSELSGLVLDGNDFGDDGLRIITHGSNLRALKHLSVCACRIEDPGIAALADSPVLEHLESLDIGTNQVTLAGYEALANTRRLSNLKSVNVGRHVEKSSRAKVVALLSKRYDVLTT